MRYSSSSTFSVAPTHGYTYIRSACFLVLLLLLGFHAQAQDPFANYISQDSIDAYALRTPKNLTHSIETLTHHLVFPYEREQDKVRSIYAWIVGNLNYDHNLARKEKRPRIKPHLILRYRRAVCIGYADLFNAMCAQAGIKSTWVSGYTREYNFKSKKPFSWSEHAWNAVNIEGEWFLLDPTWENKSIRKTKVVHQGKTVERVKISVGDQYFLTNPEDFVLDHLPDNPVWQLLPCPLSLSDFQMGLPNVEALLLRPDTCYNYNDTLAAQEKLNPAYRELLSGYTAYSYNPKNHVTLGLSLMNYGSHLSLLNSKNKDLDWLGRLEQEQLVLSYYQQSLPHLRKSKRKHFLKACKKNIKSCKKRLHSYKQKAKKQRQIMEKQRQKV
ncbi:transglutaminase domain-containing protein [Rufibacter roseus]|uniref:Transglutaminase domain-containing protein n=1 Tax=Rufibacter roseus TaxID=1567108 RepID=A0ABW2DQD5_9BACT|nr:transglutaminase domain-containing protein [Rufibacter roseus]